MCPTFMVVDGQGENIENYNIWKMASHGVLYVPKYYNNMLSIMLYFVKLFLGQVFLNFAFELHEGFFLLLRFCQKKWF